MQTFADRLCMLVKEILASRNVNVHSISFRVKTRNSLKDKIGREGKSYSTLLDITDTIGIRIITYFADDVDVIAKLVESEFEIDPENSIDKRKLLDPDRFGYLSLHYIVSLLDARRMLPEYGRFPNYKAEIQIRSILQHAWAEIEHDLGYKTQQAIPSHIRRRFSRLSGLLELADQEFQTIRETMQAYEREIPTIIEENPDIVGIDKISLPVFIKNNSIAKNLDREIANTLKPPQTLQEYNGYPEMLSSKLKYLGINSISLLENELRKRVKIIPAVAKVFRTERNSDDIPEGISIFFMCSIIIAETNNLKAIIAYFTETFVSATGDREQAAIKLLKAYQQIVKNAK